MSLLREALARTESYERELLGAIEARTCSRQDYIRCQMLQAQPLLRRMRRLLAPGQVRVLDVGCGTGGISLYLASQGFQVTAVDCEQYEQEALRAAREHSGEQRIPLRLSLADAADLPFTDRAFDCVVCSNVVEHLEDPERALAEIHRVLAPGGLAFVDFPLFRSPYGGHIAEVIRIPWFHLLPRTWVEAELHRRGAAKERAVFLSLSGIKNSRFRRIVTKLQFEILEFRRSHFITHPGRKLLVSLLRAVRYASPSQGWRGLREAMGEFSWIQLAQFPFLLLAVPFSYVPGLDEVLASGVNYVLRKPLAAAASQLHAKCV